MKRIKTSLLVVERVSKTGRVKSQKVIFRKKVTHHPFTPPPESKRLKRGEALLKKITTLTLISEIPDWPL